jgi:hypothetical protein
MLPPVDIHRNSVIEGRESRPFSAHILSAVLKARHQAMSAQDCIESHLAGSKSLQEQETYNDRERSKITLQGLSLRIFCVLPGP